MKLSFWCQVQSTGNVALTWNICFPPVLIWMDQEYQINFLIKDYCDFTVHKQIFILYWKRTPVHSSIITVKTNKWLYSQTDWDSFCRRTHTSNGRFLGFPISFQLWSLSLRCEMEVVGNSLHVCSRPPDTVRIVLSPEFLSCLMACVHFLSLPVTSTFVSCAKIRHFLPSSMN